MSDPAPLPAGPVDREWAELALNVCQSAWEHDLAGCGDELSRRVLRVTLAALRRYELRTGQQRLTHPSLVRRTPDGRLPDPGMAVLCASCDQPRQAHGGRRHLGACPGHEGLHAQRFSRVAVAAHSEAVSDPGSPGDHNPTVDPSVTDHPPLHPRI
ncbi:MAG TPA: hypothetical protein VG276_28255 [Actinomycetes bacterium]|jgi:hypothetical protein|nr:hypothetical protein [Actinomycetes bacterium]